jgi:hypothetical protein
LPILQNYQIALIEAFILTKMTKEKDGALLHLFKNVYFSQLMIFPLGGNS